jgi:hypothetical protein
MSFEDTARDLFELFQLSWKVSDNCRQACGEKEPLTREVASVHAVVVQLQREAERPNSSLHWQDDVSRDEFEDTIYDCRKALKIINQVLNQYAFSRQKGGAKKGLFKFYCRFPNGEEFYMSELLAELSGYKTDLQRNLRQLTPSSRGSVDWPLAKKYPGMQQKLDKMMADISSSHDGSSRSSSYSDDEKTVWKQVKKGLVRAGWSQKVIKKHRKAIKTYVKMLGWTDSFDELPRPVHPSLHRFPDEVSPRDTYSPENPNYSQESFEHQNPREQSPPRQNFPQPPFHHQNFPPQNFPPPPPANFPPPPPANFPPPPPANFPPQNFQPQNFPPQNLPPPPPPNFPPQNLPQNFSQQSFPPPNFPPQDFPPQNFPQDTFHQQNLSPPPFHRQIFPQPSFVHRVSPPPTFTRNILEQEVYPQDDASQGSYRPQSSRSNLSMTPPPPPPPPPQHYNRPSVSEDCEQFDEKSDFSPPEQTQSQFSARPYDLADNFKCSDKDTWNDMMESLVTTLIDTSKNI